MKEQNDPIGDIEQISFHKLMQMLCAPTEQFQGCEILFPETVFFDSKLGKASEFIKTNNEGYLISIKSEKRLNLLGIKESFKKIMRKRREASPSANRENELLHTGKQWHE